MASLSVSSATPRADRIVRLLNEGDQLDAEYLEAFDEYFSDEREFEDIYAESDVPSLL